MKLQIIDVEHGACSLLTVDNNEYNTQKTIPFYSRIAKGGPFGQELARMVLTTRCDGYIAFEFKPGSWGPRP